MKWRNPTAAPTWSWNYYEQALQWVQEPQRSLQPGWKEELEAFRAEAKALLEAQAGP